VDSRHAEVQRLAIQDMPTWWCDNSPQRLLTRATNNWMTIHRMSSHPALKRDPWEP